MLACIVNRPIEVHSYTLGIHFQGLEFETDQRLLFQSRNLELARDQVLNVLHVDGTVSFDLVGVFASSFGLASCPIAPPSLQYTFEELLFYIGGKVHELQGESIQDRRV